MKKARWVTACALGFASLVGALPAAAATDINAWLAQHHKIAYSIKWEFERDNYPNSYDPKESGKISWEDWSPAQKAALAQAFAEAEAWYASPNRYQNLNETIVYPPDNLDPDSSDDTKSAYMRVSEEYAWDMYLRWVAQTLLGEVQSHFPWSLENYDTGMLKTLLDSTSMFRRLGWGEYNWSTGSPSHHNYVRPDGNVGVGLVAPPR
jgi:hypothetical protein